MSHPLVTWNDYSVSRGDQVLFSGPSWEILPGQRVLLTGPSGSGKSSFLLALAGLTDEQVPGLRSRGTLRRPESVGLVLQNPYAQLVCASVEEELAFPLENAGWRPSEMRTRVEELARFWGLDALGSRAPWTFSGGEAQRLALASTLAPRPALVLLDEPLGYLDSAASAQLVRLLSESDRASAYVVVDHDPEPWRNWADVHYCWSASGWVLAPLPPAPPRVVPLGSGKVGSLLLQLERTSFGYGRGPDVIRDFSLDIYQGESVALVGPSGSGKSTIFRGITGQLRPRSGTLRWQGQAYRPRLNRPQPLWWVPQVPEHGFIAPTVAAELSDRRDLAAAFRLNGLLDRHPFTLSEGEKRRLNLATALASDRPLLLLDEPEFGLDSDARIELGRLLGNLRAQGRSILVISHETRFCVAQTHRQVVLTP